MITTKYFSSSIPTSFACVFLVSTLFGACCFSFIYLHPQQDHASGDDDHTIHDIKLSVDSPAEIEGVRDAQESLRKEQEESDGGLIEELVANKVNSTNDPPLVVEEVVNTTTPLLKSNKEKDEIESTPVVVVEEDLYAPPPMKNASKEGRIAWFKERVPRMKIFESTKKTRMFDQRIQEFFQGCEVRFFVVWISSSLFGKRELLSLESVLKTHPTGCVVIVSKSMDSKLGRGLVKPIVEKGYKVLSVAPDLSLLFDNTPAKPWLEGLKAGEFDPGIIPITQNLSNLLRLVLLYKYGGIYLDVDVIILKDVSGLRNCVGIHSVYDDGTRIFKSLHNAVLIFDQNHPLLLKFIEEFTAHFDGNVPGHNGPDLLTRIVVEFTHTEGYDFNIMSPTAFYPVAMRQLPKYFQRPKNENETQWVYDENYILKRESYAIHLWSHVSNKLKIEDHSLTGRLFSDHCIICKDVYDIDTPSTSL